jgi:hypothetical protein
VHRHWAVAAATLPAEKLTTRAAAAASDTTMGRIEILGEGAAAAASDTTMGRIEILGEDRNFRPYAGAGTSIVAACTSSNRFRFRRFRLTD